MCHLGDEVVDRVFEAEPAFLDHGDGDGGGDRLGERGDPPMASRSSGVGSRNEGVPIVSMCRAVALGDESDKARGVHWPRRGQPWRRGGWSGLIPVGGGGGHIRWTVGVGGLIGTLSNFFGVMRRRGAGGVWCGFWNGGCNLPGG